MLCMQFVCDSHTNPHSDVVHAFDIHVCNTVAFRYLSSLSYVRNNVALGLIDLD